jgi:ketosteroid isomerase-like protein
MKKSIALIAALLFAAGFSTVFGQSAAKSNNKEADAITRELNSTADGWNAGDLKKYLAVYIPGAQEMTGEGPKGGVGHIEQTMKNGFWKTGRPLQVLRYENVGVTMLGKKNALVTGQYILSGGGRPDRKGWFTTVWVKTKDGWRMMHDHS